MSFEESLRDMGFALDRESRGIRYYVARPNPFLTYSLHVSEDGLALFTWEFAVSAYASSKGLQVGSGEDLNTFLYPREDVRGPQDAAWVAAQVERAEHVLRSFSLLEAD